MTADLYNLFLARTLDELCPNVPLTIGKNESVRAAIEILVEHEFGCLPVVDENDKLCGIFTERDALQKILLSRYDLDATPVSAVMSPDPHSETMSSTVVTALQVMSRHGFRHLPIVDDANYVVGVISVKDIVDLMVYQSIKELFRAKPDLEDAKLV